MSVSFVSFIACFEIHLAHNVHPLNHHLWFIIAGFVQLTILHSCITTALAQWGHRNQVSLVHQTDTYRHHQGELVHYFLKRCAQLLFPLTFTVILS
jgi:hypothetical protein